MAKRISSRSIVVGLLIEIATVRPTLGQHLRAETPHEQVGVPSSQPQPRKRLMTGPVALIQALLGNDREKKGAALRQLGVTADSVELSGLHVDFINLAQDHNCEAVLTFSDDNRSTSVFVMYGNGDEWWQIGEFHYWWHWDSEQAEHFIEFRETVWPGTKDIIVRTRSGGTDLVQTEFSIYRVYEAKLYKVFDIVAEKEYSALGVPGVQSFYERASISFMTEDDAGVPSIVVDRTRTAMGDNRAYRRRPLSCDGYAWSAKTFSFTRDQNITSNFCRSLKGGSPGRRIP